jgi:hypothetical protein
MNDASSLFRTPYDPRRPTVSSAPIFDEAGQQEFDSALSELIGFAFTSGGVDAFVSTKLEAAAHEAGHAVIDAALGDEVRSVSVFRLPNHERRARALGSAGEVWAGVTSATKTRECGPHTDPREDLKIVWRVIGGWVGEFSYSGRVRVGSSLNEIVVAQMVCHAAALKLGEDSPTLFINQIGVVKDILVANKATHEALTARLMRRSSIGPNALKTFLKNVRRAPSAAND